jgi:hypothetical protein
MRVVYINDADVLGIGYWDTGWVRKVEANKEKQPTAPTPGRSGENRRTDL